MEKLRRYVERVAGNVQWVIRQLGNNLYKEGTVPPPLSPKEQVQLEKDIEEFLARVPEQEADQPGDPWEDIVDQMELLDLSDEDDEETDSLYDEWVVVRIDRLGRIYQNLRIL